MADMTITVPILLLVVCATVAMAAVQAIIGSKIGSDSAVHLFVIRQLRRHGKLFTQIPNLLNRPHCGAMPIYLHATLAKLPDTALRYAPFVLNPFANLATLLLTIAIGWAIATRSELGGAWLVSAALLAAFCPQMYHALSARNFGFSSRGLGIFLTTLFFAGLLWRELDPAAAVYAFVLMAFAAYLIFAFNTFAMQGLFLIGLTFSLISWSFAHWLAMVAGLGLFIVLHPKYSLSYLEYTIRFILSYRRDLAAVYILARRYSVWRDLVWDIPKRIAASRMNGFRYAYENTVLIVLLLNPVAVIGVIAWFQPEIRALPGMDVAASVTVAGALVAFLTSFRATRFLGEPERYLESVTPWAAISGATLAWSLGSWALVALVIYCLAASAAQTMLSRMLVRHVSAKPLPIEEAATVIERDADGTDIRLASNNEQLTKLFMVKDWEFSYFIAVGEPYCGLTVQQSFRQLPYLKRDAIEHICRVRHINYLILDRSEYDSIYDVKPEGLDEMREIFSTDGMRVLRLRWTGPLPASDAVQ